MGIVPILLGVQSNVEACRIHLADTRVCLQGPYLAGYTAANTPPFSYGLQRLDHAVGNVHDLQATLDYITKATGFHQFAEFTAEVSRVRKVAKLVIQIPVHPVLFDDIHHMRY